MSSISYIAPPKSKLQIIETADELRDNFGLKNKLCFPIVEFADVVLQKIYKSYSFEVCEITDMKDNYAQYNPIDNIMTIREDVYNDALIGNGRARFTIAHEVAHYVLHGSGIVLARGDSDIKIYQDPEWQANVFASELLMPSYLINGMSAEYVSSMCKTSFLAAQIALNNTRKIS